MSTEFRLPKLAESGGLGTVARVCVAPGDTIRAEDPVVEMETDKAVVEVPSSVSGVVKEVLVKQGDEIGEDALLIKVDEEASDAQGGEAAEGAEAPEPEAPHEDEAPQAQPPAERPAVEAAQPPPGQRAANVVQLRRDPAPEPPKTQVAAAPSVRRLAREVGVNLAEVAGSGRGGRVTAEDVKAHAKRLLESGPAAPRSAAELPDFSRFGPVRREPLSAVRKATATHLGQSWPAVPQVTQYDEADVTDLEALRHRFGRQVEAAGGKLTVTAILLKVCATALKLYPKFNSSLDAKSNELVFKEYIHIGVAVDTDRGLLVPVVRSVDQKSIKTLSVELSEIAQKARDRKLGTQDMEGGSFTISNLGGIGGVGFSPIVNAPEVAILGVARGSTRPVWRDGTFAPRQILPLSLSYDHRVIDGAEAARFLRTVCNLVEEPFLLSLEG